MDYYLFLILNLQEVKDLKNSTDVENITCTFEVANLNATSMKRASADTTFVMVIGSGALEGGKSTNIQAQIYL